MNYNGLDDFSYNDLISFTNVYKTVRNVSVSVLPFTLAYATFRNDEIGVFLFATNALLAGTCAKTVKTANNKIAERDACKYSLVKRHRAH